MFSMIVFTLNILILKLKFENLEIDVMRGRMRHRGVGSVTNRLGSEWPLYEYDLADYLYVIFRILCHTFS